MYKALFISPMVPSFDLPLSMNFFQTLLGFQVTMETEGYTVINKDGLTIHFLTAGSDIGQMEFYLEVDQIDALWDDIKAKVGGLRHKAPFDRAYGMREIHIDVPGTNTLLFIGQRIEPT
jgi:predicted enzyme related to lactoylglutathione lyase